MTAETTVGFVVGDAHVPHQDMAATSVALQILHDLKPDTLYFNGDMHEGYSTSRFKQPGSPGPGFRAEIDGCHEFLKLFCAESPKSKKKFIEGNHEYRLRSYLNNKGSDIKGAKWLTIVDQLELKSLGIEYIPAKGSRWFSTWEIATPDLLVGHFDKTSAISAYAAKALIERHGMSLITGHGHSMGVHHRRMTNRIVTAYEGGCLMTLDPNYQEGNGWKHGVCIYYHVEGHPTQVEQIHIENGRARFGGRLYKA